MGGLADGVQPVTVADGSAKDAKLPAGKFAGEKQDPSQSFGAA